MTFRVSYGAGVSYGFAAVASVTRDGCREWGVARFDAIWSHDEDPPDLVAAGVGAVTFLGTAEPRYRDHVRDRLQTGTATDVIDEYGAGIGKWRERQLAVVDRFGGVGAYTGGENNPWAGDLCVDDFAAVGNSLLGPQVLDAMRDAWLNRTETQPLARQLVAALLGARAAGGSRLTSQRMGGFVMTVSEALGSVPVRVRVRGDNDADPLDELAKRVCG